MSDISPKLIFSEILRKLWAIVLCAVICAVGAYVYFSNFVNPVYRATASIIVTNGAVSTDRTEYIASSSISASASMLTTCADILRTKDAYKFLTEEFNNKYTASNYASMTSISVRSRDSLFIDISVNNNSKALAVKIVNAFTENAPNYIKSVIPSSEVTVMELAETATVVSPRVMLMTFTAAFLGAIIPIVIITILAIADTTVKGEDDLADKYNVAILGNVPDFDITSR